MKISENLQKKEKVLSLRQERGDQLYLNERCISIIKILLENGNINIIDLAEKFEISGRSIRYDIDNIDFIFTAENIKLLKKDKNGIFTLETNDKKEIERIIQTYSVLSSEERIVYLMVKLLTENIINLTLEAKNLEVSRSTLKTDYNILKNYLENAGIKIITLSNKGLSILGREEDIRKIFIKCFMNLLSQKMALKSTLKNLINDLYEKVDIEKVKIFINKIQTDFNKKVSDSGYNAMLSYLIIMKSRYDFRENIDQNISNEIFLKKTLEYKTINSNKEYLGNNVLEYDLLNITDIFLGSHSYNEETSFYENWIDIEILVKKIIDDINKKLDVDISKDKLLLEGLLVHIKPTIYRIKNKISLENDIYDELMEIEKELFEKVKDSIKVLEEFLDVEIPNQEIAFLVIHFKAAIDRGKQEQGRRKNILFVCKMGYITSKILAEKIADNYEINIVDTIPYYLLDDYNYKNIDLVISTVDINKKIPRSHIVINPLLEEGDLKKLEKQGIRKKKNKIMLSTLLEVTEKYIRNGSQNKLIEDLVNTFGDIIQDDREFKNLELLDILKEDRIGLKKEFTDWKECIKECGWLLEKSGCISNEYTLNVIEAVESYGSYMVITPKVILPHAKNDRGVFKTSLCLMSLKKEIAFPSGKEIGLVIFFSSRDKIEHLSAMRTLVELLSEYNFKEKIKEFRTGKEVIEYIKNYKKGDMYV